MIKFSSVALVAYSREQINTISTIKNHIGNIKPDLWYKIQRPFQSHPAVRKKSFRQRNKSGTALLIAFWGRNAPTGEKEQRYRNVLFMIRIKPGALHSGETIMRRTVYSGSCRSLFVDSWQAS